jgi:RNA recognition motif-containing protein
MKKYLYYLFMTYGRVTDIILLPKMRGQAFIVFQAPAMALNARKSLSEYIFFGKPLVSSTPGTIQI